MWAHPDDEAYLSAGLMAMAVRRIADVIASVHPHTVLTFGPEGMTGHADHQAVSRWARSGMPPGWPMSSSASGELPRRGGRS